MATGKKAAQGVGTVSIQPIETDMGCFHRIRLETSGSFDRTITFQKRVQQDVGQTAVTGIASWYKKESDGSIASAALTPGASNKSEYLLDGAGGIIDVVVSGGTAGTVDIYWASIRA